MHTLSGLFFVSSFAPINLYVFFFEIYDYICVQEHNHVLKILLSIQYIFNLYLSSTFPKQYMVANLEL